MTHRGFNAVMEIAFPPRAGALRLVTAPSGYFLMACLTLTAAKPPTGVSRTLRTTNRLTDPFLASLRGPQHDAERSGPVARDPIR